jgi:Uma2 family endonuclease
LAGGFNDRPNLNSFLEAGKMPAPQELWQMSNYQLVEGVYQRQQFRESECLISPTFPDLNLFAQQIFAAVSN